VLSAAGWALVLYRTLAHLLALSSPTPTVAASSAGARARASSLFASLKPSGHPLVWVPSIVPARLAPLYVRACTAYDAVGSTTARVQSAAVLEVLHVLVGLVRSPLPTTAVQVASRLFSVWCIAARFPSVRPSKNKIKINNLILCFFLGVVVQKQKHNKKNRLNVARSTPAWCSRGR
jgi:very-long-chain (3R)-3-hydroxyacyl-CoA dehydratase